MGLLNKIFGKLMIRYIGDYGIKNIPEQHKMWVALLQTSPGPLTTLAKKLFGPLYKHRYTSKIIIDSIFHTYYKTRRIPTICNKNV
jgi:hypothetical protein